MDPFPLLRVALAQVDPTVGDIQGNVAKVLGGIERARDAGAQLVVFPEMVVTGYPAEDLWLKEHVLRDARAAVDELAAASEGIVTFVGFPERAEDVYNSLAVLADGEVRAIYRKVYLPNYGVFDEQRYFQTGPGGALLDLGGVPIGLTICEDMWEPGPPASEEALAGAVVLVNLSCSPYHAGKGVQRERMFAQRARDYDAAVLFCNVVGGQDELVFDGHSFVMDHEGEVVRARRPVRGGAADRHRRPGRGGRQAPARRRPPPRRAPLASRGPHRRRAPSCPSPPSRSGRRWEARSPSRWTAAPRSTRRWCCGLRDYVEKNRFGHVVLGLSGGIDSALVALIAVDALGPERVSVAIMPSRYSSEGTQGDARALAANLGVEAHRAADRARRRELRDGARATPSRVPSPI